MKLILISTMLAVINGLPQYDPPRKPSRPSNGGGRPGSKYLPAGRPGGPGGAGGPGSGGAGGPGFGGPGSGGPGGPFDGADEEPLIQKSVYLHVPPPELEEAPAPPKTIVSGRKEKHYKIIFVKAPVPAAPAAPIIPPSPTKEEKTIVYVLVKKPEEGQDIVIPTQPPSEPVKPEVYFIRYKANKKDGEDGEDGGDGYSDGRPSFGGISPEYLPPGGSY